MKRAFFLSVWMALIILPLKPAMAYSSFGSVRASKPPEPPSLLSSATESNSDSTSFSESDTVATPLPNSPEEVSPEVEEAAPTCPVCLESIEGEASVGACYRDHRIHSDCLYNQSLAITNVLQLRDRGFKCSTRECPEHIPFQNVLPLFTQEQREALATRIQKASASASEPSQPKAETTRHASLALRLQEALNLKCPHFECGLTLDSQIGGCNAANCPYCDRHFCYLCLKPLRSKEATHEHVLQHSRQYWEFRPGFSKRYHCLIFRRQLELAFEQKVAKDARKEVLGLLKDRLNENNLWPLAAGTSTKHWLREVDEEILDRDQKIELLQNELIFLRSKRKAGCWSFLRPFSSKGEKLIKAQLKRLNAPVLTSLDATPGDRIEDLPHPRERQNGHNPENDRAIAEALQDELNRGVFRGAPIVQVWHPRLERQREHERHQRELELRREHQRDLERQVELLRPYHPMPITEVPGELRRLQQRQAQRNDEMRRLREQRLRDEHEPQNALVHREVERQAREQARRNAEIRRETQRRGL